MVPTFSGTRFDLQSLQTVSVGESCPRSIVRHGCVWIIDNLKQCLCVCGLISKPDLTLFDAERWDLPSTWPWEIWVRDYVRVCVGFVPYLDKLPDYESGDSRFESWQSPLFFAHKKNIPTRTEGLIMFCSPSNILVVGPSGCARTVFVSELLKEPHRHFRPIPKLLHYCYSTMQLLLQELRDRY